MNTSDGRKNDQRQHDQQQHQQEGAFYLLVLGALVLAGAAVFTLFKISRETAVVQGAYVLFACVLFAKARYAMNEGGIRTALGFSIAIALLITPMLLAFPILAWAVTALYLLALLVGLWKELTGFLKFLAGLAAVAMPVALVVLPVPDGATSSYDDREWTIIVTARDADGEPVADAFAHCTAVMIWDQARRLEARPEWLQVTGDDGRAEFSFHADTRLKAALCSAEKPAREGVDGFAWHFAPAIRGLHPGGEYPVTIVLDERIPALPVAQD